jgi:hypothetical protein
MGEVSRLQFFRELNSCLVGMEHPCRDLTAKTCVIV